MFLHSDWKRRQKTIQSTESFQIVEQGFSKIFFLAQYGDVQKNINVRRFLMRHEKIDLRVRKMMWGVRWSINVFGKEVILLFEVDFDTIGTGRNSESYFFTQKLFKYKDTILFRFRYYSCNDVTVTIESSILSGELLCRGNTEKSVVLTGDFNYCRISSRNIFVIAAIQLISIASSSLDTVKVDNGQLTTLWELDLNYAQFFFSDWTLNNKNPQKGTEIWWKFMTAFQTCYTAQLLRAQDLSIQPTSQLTNTKRDKVERVCDRNFEAGIDIADF